ncbi:unnamed protein product [Ceutorhynchus assimilis]|uniref:Pectinesterase n=1 Tax=Ceutorhynchus assimilis TaxID=467358 RepID=A0A9N9MWY1_9CUCU|nr:unnamed protein product [Ceutorhynchus assimilis]
MKTTIAFIALLIVSSSRADQTYPGTSTRPILNSAEASDYTKTSYLQGWLPETISTTAADFTVGGSGGFSTIQEAVNAAINTKSSNRQYIKINTGKYSQVVYIPNTDVPLTIYGTSDVVISLSVSALLTGTEYQTLVGGLFAPGDPAYETYVKCAIRTAIGTTCSSVFWVKAANVELINLTIENSSKNVGTDQAVALNINADKVQVSNSRLLGHQDTLYAGSGKSKTLRNYFFNTYVEGDVDFVFGHASAVFEQCTFHVKDDRRNYSGIVFAPSTNPNNQYGYLVVGGTITGDGSWFRSQNVYLARSWDAGVKSEANYIAGTSPNGQLVIRDTKIDAVVINLAPYNKAATSGRKFAGNNNTNRNLSDNNFNRFWEFNNSGSGA